MERVDLILSVKRYFNIRELVCPHTYEKWGEKSWNFLDDRLLRTLIILRTEVLRVPLICNVPSKGVTQRGLRCNVCELVKEKTVAGKNYLTQHSFGKAVDLIPQGMTAEEARERIKSHKNNFPFPIRIEKGVSWLHIDVMDCGSGNIITEFVG